MANSPFKILIEYDYLTYYPDGTIRGYDRAQPIYLDQVDNVTISANSDLTVHPMLNADLVADHIIKKPITLGFSGTFSTQGSTKSDLIAQEKLFEEIKNNGWLCSISKISNVTNKPCFIKRNNMILTSIRWTEGINTVSYSFSFEQILVANQLQYTKADLQELPETKQATWSSFNILSFYYDTIKDARNQLAPLILKSMLDAELMDEGFYSKISVDLDLVKSSEVDEGKRADILGILSLVPIINAFVPLVETIREIKKLCSSGTFPLWRYTAGSDIPTYRANKSRCVEIINQILNTIYQTFSSAMMYKFTSNEPNQNIIMSVNDNYYEVRVRKDILSYLSIYYLEDDAVMCSNKCMQSSKIANFYSCTKSNAICRLGGNYYVYIIKSVRGQVDETILTNYGLFVTPILPDQVQDAVLDIITKCVMDVIRENGG